MVFYIPVIINLLFEMKQTDGMEEGREQYLIPQLGSLGSTNPGVSSSWAMDQMHHAMPTRSLTKGKKVVMCHMTTK